MSEKKLKVQIGDTGQNSRVSFDGQVVPGVAAASVEIDADGLTMVVLVVNALNCEIVQENVE